MEALGPQVVAVLALLVLLARIFLLRLRNLLPISVRVLLV